MRTSLPALPALPAAALLLTAAAASAQPAFFQLPDGTTPTSLTTDGSVVVGNTASEYFLFTADGGLELIGGVAPGQGAGGQAAISADGRFVGGTELNDATGFNEISRYDVAAGAWTNLGGLGGTQDGQTSSGYGITGDGDQVVGLARLDGSGPGLARAVISNDPAGTGLTDLGSTVAGNSSRANGADFDGDVVVGWQDADFRQGAVWIDGDQTLLTLNDGSAVGEAFNVTPDGRFAVGVGVSDSGRQAYRADTTTGIATNLGTLSGIFNPSGSATDIADDGATVIGFNRPFGPPVGGQGFIWTEDGGIQDLGDFLLASGVPLPADFEPALPLAISGDGTTIAGLGRVGFRVTPFVVVVPEPATATAAMLASALLLRRRR